MEHLRVYCKSVVLEPVKKLFLPGFSRQICFATGFSRWLAWPPCLQPASAGLLLFTGKVRLKPAGEHLSWKPPAKAGGKAKTSPAKARLFGLFSQALRKGSALRNTWFAELLSSPDFLSS